MIFATGFVMCFIAFYVYIFFGAGRGKQVNGADMVWIPLTLIGPIFMAVSICLTAIKYLP